MKGKRPILSRAIAYKRTAPIVIANDSPHLIVQSSDKPQRIQLTDQNIWTFGRSQVNSIPLQDRCASRHHAKLERVQEKHFYFVDLNSRNGSLINGQRVTQPVLLAHGDRITIGNTHLVFHQERLTVPGIPMPLSEAFVFMVQCSTMQGKIWQELLLSQGIPVRWGVPGGDLRQTLALQAAARDLPKVLLLDMRACGENPLVLCHLLGQQSPGLKVFLLDNLHADGFSQDQKEARRQGCECIFPAFRKRRLSQDFEEIAARLQLVLQAIDGRSLQQHRLQFALNKLEELFKQMSTFVPIVPSVPSAESKLEVRVDHWDDEDPTALNMG